MRTLTTTKVAGLPKLGDRKECVAQGSKKPAALLRNAHGLLV